MWQVWVGALRQRRRSARDGGRHGRIGKVTVTVKVVWTKGKGREGKGGRETGKWGSGRQRGNGDGLYGEARFTVLGAFFK